MNLDQACAAPAREGLWLAPFSLLLTAIGVAMICLGETKSLVAGWFLVALCGPGVLIAPLMAARGFRRPRWTSGRLVARRLALDTAAFVLLGADYAGFFAWAAWLTWAPRGAASDALTIAACVAFLLSAVWFLIVSASVLLELFDTRPVITVDDTGYFHRRLMRRPIPWDRIDRLEARRRNGRAIFCLVANGQGASRRLFARLNALQGFPGFVVSGGQIDCTVADVLLAIHHYAPRLFGAEDAR